MIDLLTWSLFVIGVTYAITCSFVFALPRILISRLGTFARYYIYCAWCVSFWVGLLYAAGMGLAQGGHFDWFVLGGYVLGRGFMAMGLISIFKAAFPTFLEPPYEAEQGTADEDDSGDDRPLLEPADTILIGGSGNGAKCQHRFKRVGPDERCILCGADK